MRFLLAVYFFLCTCNFGYAQTKNLNLNLNSNIVKDVLQEESGLIWVGTDEGLNVLYDDEKQVFWLI